MGPANPATGWPTHEAEEQYIAIKRKSTNWGPNGETKGYPNWRAARYGPAAWTGHGRRTWASTWGCTPTPEQESTPSQQPVILDASSDAIRRPRIQAQPRQPMGSPKTRGQNWESNMRFCGALRSAGFCAFFLPLFLLLWFLALFFLPCKMKESLPLSSGKWKRGREKTKGFRGTCEERLRMRWGTWENLQAPGAWDLCVRDDSLDSGHMWARRTQQYYICVGSRGSVMGRICRFCLVALPCKINGSGRSADRFLFLFFDVVHCA